ncbi:aspartate 1-decarboxylase [Bdellovibrio bacteriovorus]|uniref:Aspartate 1-decarboxylase n=2 Tax=Bdellovibrio bacteriovorus TaxID=959 RepID=PAND_BDEBA|nr:aspartate 1-decarboxylase [Bdellovibrio bacteriovorus]Q6MHH9.1 RecName: Full=Aspartate 1-decarboxylase; AltName: Full=Aspartate alpha-decarboxylase; Contains: RecName: Full=Aspartate 1-decarboxylase beta chain; Contains: RecName: Full=Aspartate 1-decarboxylase alpha chain; Flags: Precursor [Bdellovibrio bacteriovorus HD100]AHZ83915.1 aspartate decarboxylase [Bdellovibrio bacteriovorus]ASD62364.1 aspartate 1-decarboxylase [Bdellovibrio bacteriovorus]CAE78353.1 panD [Bdellovibrio bacteriovorus
MNISLLRTKIHRATVTGADLNYEGSVSICPDLIKASGLLMNERVDIYNCNNGARFSTYVIKGKKGEICLNGAAARHVQKGDLVIICSYCGLSMDEAKKHEPTVVFVNAKNKVTEKRKEDRKNNK